MRVMIFKKYWNKFKYNRAAREQVMQLLDEADEQAGYYYGDNFKTWRQEIDGVEEFLEEIAAQKKLKDSKLSRKGNTIVRTIKGEDEALDK